jgi:aquaporin Z
MDVTFAKKLAAECFGTFCLVFAGTGAIIINDLSGGAVTHAGVAITFGLVVFAMIVAIGDISGAHLNPAVTLGFFLAGRFPGKAVIPYIVSQCFGTILASGTLFTLFPNHRTLGSTIPAGSAFQSLILEILLTFILVYVILNVTASGKEKGITVGIIVGAVIALSALFAGPVSGASMNPARSLAPALFSRQLDHIWVYLTGPFLGAVFSVPLCRFIRKSGCCRTPLRGVGYNE